MLTHKIKILFIYSTPNLNCLCSVLILLAHGWVGWNNKNRPLTITFEFSQRQEFKSVTLTTFCQLDLGIQPFSQMLAYFSTDGLTYHQQYVKVVNKQLSISGQAQNITLSLAQRIGIPNNIRNKKIKVRFL